MALRRRVAVHARSTLGAGTANMVERAARPPARVAAAGMLALALLAGCGAGAAQASPQATAKKPLEKVTLRLPWLIGSYDVPFVYAKAQGYYRAAGLDVAILEGKGSATTTETVANGSDTFGAAAAGVVAKLISKGEPVKVVADFVQNTVLSFIHEPDVVIRTPRDLIGKKIITAPGDADLQMLPAVLSRYGMTLKQLELLMVSPASHCQTFARMPHAILLGALDGTYDTCLSLSPKAVYTPYTKFGVNVYDIGLITGRQEMQQHPAQVRRFVAASVRGWQAAVKNPSAAVDATVQAFPKAKKQLLLKGLQAIIRSLLHTPATKGHSVGWMAKSDWRQTVDLMHRYGGMKTVKPLSDYYTNAYLPQGSR